jgi:hypothetical protein
MTKSTFYANDTPDTDTASRIPGAPVGLARWIGRRLLHEGREALPPTIFFFVGFNFVVLTSNLLVAHYLIGLGNFMLATLGALVVGKAVLVANKIPLLRRYDRAALIRPILFKTAFYWAVVFLARLIERFVHFSFLQHNRPTDFFRYLMTTFSGHRFAAISLWMCVLFLIYVTASEFGRLFGPGEIPRLLFSNRPSELQLNRRQRMRELLRLSRLTDGHSADEFRNPTSAAHRELIDIVQRLARVAELRDHPCRSR